MVANGWSHMNPWKSGCKKNGEIISPTKQSWIGRKYGTKSKQKKKMDSCGQHGIKKWKLMIGERSPTWTYPKCVGGVIWVCLKQFSITSMSGHKGRELGNGPLPLLNACKP